jgi:hypothetical protein
MWTVGDRPGGFWTGFGPATEPDPLGRLSKVVGHGGFPDRVPELSAGRAKPGAGTSSGEGGHRPGGTLAGRDGSGRTLRVAIAMDRGTFSLPGPLPVPARARGSTGRTSPQVGCVPHASPKSPKQLWGGGWDELCTFDGFDPGEFRVLSPQNPTLPIQKAFFLRFCRLFVTTGSATLSDRVQNLFAYYMKGWVSRTCTGYVSGELCTLASAIVGLHRCSELEPTLTLPPLSRPPMLRDSVAGVLSRDIET